MYYYLGQEGLGYARKYPEVGPPNGAYMHNAPYYDLLETANLTGYVSEFILFKRLIQDSPSFFLITINFVFSLSKQQIERLMRNVKRHRRVTKAHFIGEHYA